MIISEYSEVVMSPKCITYYRNKGYNVKYGEKVKISIKDLNINSKNKITVKCDHCGIIKEISYADYIKITKNSDYYCKECKGQKIKTTVQKLYGVDNVFQLDEIKNKTKETNLENLGVEYAMQSENVKQKSIETSLNKYGVSHPSKTIEFKEKQADTNYKKYGVKSSAQSQIVKDKNKETNLLKYGCEFSSQNEDIKNKIRNTRILTLMNKYKKYNILEMDSDIYTMNCDCGLDHTFKISSDLFRNRIKINTILCTICNDVLLHDSGLEKQLKQFIEKNYKGEIITNSRSLIHPYELDIYLPELKIAFEFNGVYWHSELYKENNYHYKKMKKCLDNDIKLIQIFEDDWQYKKDIIKSRILNLLEINKNKIFARNCKIKKVDNKNSNLFLLENHIQGEINSSIKLGLYYNDDLVSIMTFGKLRKSLGNISIDGDYELLRFCNKLNTSVVGGASKLFSFFIKNYQYNKIISYADRNWSNGKLYEKLKFDFISETTPNYYYVVDGIKKHRFGFRKDILVKEGFDKNKSEHEIMLERKIYRIYDSGSLRYEFKKSEI